MRGSRTAVGRADGAPESRLDRILPWGSRRRSLVREPIRFLRLLAREPRRAARALARPGSWGPRLVGRAAPPPEGMTPAERYALWSSIHHRNPRVLRRKRRAARRRSTPKISILLPVHDPDPRLLALAIGSVRAQVSERWELCIVDDGSSRRDHIDGLGRLASEDPRVRLRLLEDNRGISRATNAALEMASGPFVAMLDQDDELAPDAIHEVGSYVLAHPRTDLLYTDEDKVDMEGAIVDVFFKPEWSPDLELSTNYVNHLTVVRTELLRRLGGFRSDYDGAQDYDMVLRASEDAREVGHVPLPLYSWRSAPGSVADEDAAKPWAYEAGLRALSAALERRGIPAEAEVGSFPGAYHLRWPASPGPLARIVLAEPVGTPEWSRAANEAAARAEPGDVLVFLAAGIAPAADDASPALVAHLARPGVGVAGGVVLDPGGRVLREAIVPAARRPTSDHAAYRPARELVRNASAASGACLAIPAALFAELRGFDASLGRAADVDLCLRAGELGHRVVIVGEAEWTGDPGPWPPPMDDPAFRERWSGRREPFYHPAFSLEEPYVLRI